MKLLLATALTTFAICVAALGCGSDGETSTTPATDVPGTFFGVVYQGAITPEDIERMGAGKVGTLRLVLPWGVDPSPKDGDTDLSSIDPVVIAAAESGIQVLPTIFGTPDWVAAGIDGVECGSEEPIGCGTYAPRSAEALREWKDFVGEMVDRYGPDGELWATHPDVPEIPVRTWQIWNEQNSSTFYQPKPDPEGYSRLLSSAAEAIRDRDAGAQILLGGMFQTSGNGDLMLADQFLRQLYEIDGASDDFDAVAAHPYAANLTKIETQVELLHDEIGRADDDAALWLTEIGASSADGDNPLELGEQGQADLLRGAFDYFLSKREEWKIAGLIWYSWRDTPDDAGVCDWCANSGLFPLESLSPKPSWGAFTSFTGGT
jgi:hypothetical protein